MLMTKNIVQLEINVIMQVNREAAHTIRNLKHSKPKELPCGFLS